MKFGALNAMGRIQPGWGTSRPSPTLETWACLWPSRQTGAINFKPEPAHLVNQGRPSCMDFLAIVWIHYHFSSGFGLSITRSSPAEILNRPKLIYPGPAQSRLPRPPICMQLLEPNDHTSLWALPWWLNNWPTAHFGAPCSTVIPTNGTGGAHYGLFLFFER